MENSKKYINRELSWIKFNERVLEEAWDKTNPILERLKFLSITGSNLDEFFMVRVAGLWAQAEAGLKQKDVAGMTPREQISAISKSVHELSQKQNNCLMRSILPQLSREGIEFLSFEELSPEQIKFVRAYFDDIIYPVLTPMAMDQSRPFPLLPNKSLNFIIKLIKDDEEYFALLQIPTVVSRTFALPSTEGQRQFIMLEDIIKEYLSELFTGYTIKSAHLFRLTRDADLDIDEEDAEDLLSEIEKSIKKRKWGAPVRIEIEKSMTRSLRRVLEKTLELEEEDIYEIPGYMDLTVWMKFSALPGFDHLRFPPAPPQQTPAFMKDENIFDTLKKRDVLVHHPYESFDCVLKYVRSAAEDPSVLAIKQTLYRVSGNSPIVDALISAAENGKQVTVLVELKARFDEENNILWAKKLEKAGCHVIYGLVGLKTHCKICLVIRMEDDGIRRYVHLATGNYNDNTAKIYTDFGLFTSSEAFGREISALFNVLTGYSEPPIWKKIAVAPTSLRQFFIQQIEAETALAKSSGDGLIIAKMNSLVDPEIIDALYRASAAGVKINLIVRGICCLRAGVPGLSENIRLISIIGRFLEHSRIFCFGNSGKSKIFLSSADWMPRNLDWRVEIAFPVLQGDLKSRIEETLRVSLSDTVKAREMNPDGDYDRIDRRGKEYISSQETFYEMAKAAYEKAAAVPDKEIFKPVESNSEAD